MNAAVALTAREARFVEVLRGDAQKLRAGRRTSADEPTGPIHRRRLVAAMVEVGAQEGYVQTTVSAVVRVAQVSRRTFYEHFEDKGACLLAAHAASAELVVAAVAARRRAGALGPHGPLEAGIEAFLRLLGSAPSVTRLLLVDVLALGEPALVCRRRAMERVGRALLDGDPADDATDPAHDAQLTFLIGALNELVLVSLEAGEPVAAHVPAQRLTRQVLDPAFGAAPPRLREA